MKDRQTDPFPLSQKNQTKGSRRLAREKVLQIIIAYLSSESELDELFNHIFYRIFNFDSDEVENTSKEFLRPEEILEMEADIPINWKEDDIEFGRKLVEKVVERKEYLNNLLQQFAKNWEVDRIATIDRMLVHIAVTELLDFEEIPPKVSINEAIEISKKYSTDKSRSFINGILDSILKKLKNEGKINKKGRGLKDN